MKFLSQVIRIGLLILVFHSVVTAQHTIQIDERLKPALAHWFRDMQAGGYDLTGCFRNLEHIMVGEHNAKDHVGYSDKWNETIWIAPEVIERGQYSIRTVLYHELGHYLFDLPHFSCKIMVTPPYREEVIAKHWAEWSKDYVQVCKLYEK